MIDFPSSPSVGQVFNSGSGPIYVWDGLAWSLIGPLAKNGWDTIEERSFNAVSAIDFINLSLYKRLRLCGYISLSSNANLAWRTSVDNGVNFAAGASDYAYQGQTAVDTVFGGSRVTAASFGLLGSGTSEIFEAYFENFNVSGQSCVSVTKGTSFNGNATTIFNRQDGAIRADTVARNALRIIPATAVTLTGWLFLQGVVA